MAGTRACLTFQHSLPRSLQASTVTCELEYETTIAASLNKDTAICFSTLITTIVITPYLSLTYDQARRSEENGIKHALWKQKGKDRVERYQLLFGAYENICSVNSRTWVVLILHSYVKFIRIMFDRYLHQEKSYVHEIPSRCSSRHTTHTRRRKVLAVRNPGFLNPIPTSRS